MAVFYLSSQTADDSSALSGRVSKIILSIVVPGFRTMSDLERQEWILSSQHIIRKLAHFTEYAVLGFFLCGYLHTFVSSISFRRSVISLVLSFLYASSDEFHQAFVGGRGPGFKDVLIDTSGALFGILWMLLFCFLVFRHMKKKNN
ncbi:MAG: VanZ family protein [Spirochaetales bacterium]|nr:VanZ family protein [Candidatus Physcosoma equi]